jgi:hypothetical protein
VRQQAFTTRHPKGKPIFAGSMEKYRIANLAAAKTVLEKPEKFDGILLQWALTVEREQGAQQ